MNKLLYVETGTEDAYLNFGTEYYMATESNFREKTGCDVAFLFWRTTPTLMVGKYQNIYEEINIPYVREHGINIVRRMSGGGTIYTDLGGWQFTFITDNDDDQIDFSEYLSPVLNALAALGIKAEFSGRNDILIGGRKISGNAQFKLCGKTVHHGSLLFSTDIEEMVRSTSVADYKIISKGIKSVRERVTNISEHLQTAVTPEKFKQLMIHNIAGANAPVYNFTDGEKERIIQIADERFRSWESIYGSDPRFTIKKSAHLSGGKIELHFDVKKGLITDFAMYGDFFSTINSEELKAALCGVRFEYQSILTAITESGFANAFYNISASDIARIMTE